MKSIVHIVGARPNFVKAAPVYRALQGKFQQYVFNTGQHFSKEMADDIIRELGLPITKTLNKTKLDEIRFAIYAELVKMWTPAAVIVYGDVKSTLAGALAAHSLRIPVIHVEAGLRSGDDSMPEEVNRIVVDELSSLHFTTSQAADDNFAQETYLVGNVMVDSLMATDVGDRIVDGEYALMTLHRPSNVDDPDRMKKILDAVCELPINKVIWPMHPRCSFLKGRNPVMVVPPLSYKASLNLQKSARFVLTDSGGVQEETTVFGTPCFTIRDNTERPETITHGSNTLVTPETLVQKVKAMLFGKPKVYGKPPLWDGHAAERIAEIICRKYQ